MNRLDDAGGVSGFSLPLDLAASGRGGDDAPEPAGQSCPASNEAELIYSASADPEGSVGGALPTDRLLRDVPALVAHELQHLISAGRRVPRASAGFAAAEEVWLDEALSAVSEEVVGLAALEAEVGEGLAFEHVSDTPERLEIFDTFVRANFDHLGLYLRGAAGAPTIADVDPAGVGSLQMRGFGWYLLRRLADRAGGDERAFFRSVTSGGQNQARGVANLERVAGREWADILADFSTGLVLDAADAEAVAAARGPGEGDGAQAEDAATSFGAATWGRARCVRVHECRHGRSDARARRPSAARGAAGV